MKKILLSLFISILFNISLNAQVQYQLIEERYVGPGIIYRDYFAPSRPWTINVLEIDLTNPFVKIETVKANDRLMGNETTGSMASRKSTEGHLVVGAINADFYSGGGIPIGSQILQGEIMRINSNFSTLAFSPGNIPYLDFVEYNGTVITKDSSININGINTTRNTDNLILYNSYYGNATGTNEWGTELRLQPIDPWIVNDTVRCEVVNKKSNEGNMNLIVGSAVLSAHGTAKGFVDDFISVGDTVDILNSIITMPDKITELIGGYPKIVRNGIDYVDQGYQEEGGPSHTYERHPRTGAGFSADSTKAYFITVDGRGYSIGMTLHELAQFMIYIGVHYGLNLDGGGSTTMVVRGEVMNVPSDGSQRPVANALLAISTAPVTDSLSYINLSPGYLKIFKGEEHLFSVTGHDQYYNPIAVSPNEISFTVDPNIGQIDSDGRFTAAVNVDSGYVYAEAYGLRDSAKVVIKTIGSLSLSPDNVVVDTTKAFQFIINALDEDGIQKQLDNSEFEWIVRDESIGTVDDAGLFKGKAEGDTHLIVRYEDVSDSVNVKVEIATGETLLHSFDNLDGISLGGENLNLQNCFIEVIENPVTEGTGAAKITYQFTGNTSNINYIHINTDLAFYGTPDTIAMDVMTNGNNHQIIYVFRNEITGKDFQVNVKKWANNTGQFEIQPGALEDAVSIPPGSLFYFPVTLKQVRIKLGDPRQNEIVVRDSLYIDNLRISYPGSVTDMEDNLIKPIGYSLMQNYPNPFNPKTTIEYSIQKSSFVQLTVYDILGREVIQLVDGFKPAGTHKVIFDGSNLSSSIY